MEKELENILSQNNIAFLVGAGISVDSPSNMFTGIDFNNSLIDRIAPNEELKKQLKNLLWAENPNRANKGDFLRFEGIMGILQKITDENLDILDCFADCNVPNINHYVLASLLGKGYDVFTTNFDILIEYACNDLGVEYTALINDKDFQEYSKVKNPLFKLHGSIKKQKDMHWINTKESIQATLETVGKGVEDVFSISPYKREVFTKILKEKDLIIMGYSGYDDFDIGPMLCSIQSEKKIVWLNHTSRKENEKKYSFEDLKNSQRDKNGDLIRKREECLYTMGQFLMRKPENLLLYDVNTSNVMKSLKQKNAIIVPDLKPDYQFNKEEFFSNWEKKYLLNYFIKYYVSGDLMSSLDKVDNALTAFNNCLELSIMADNQYKMAKSFSQIGAIYHVKGDYDKALSNYSESLHISLKLDDKSGIASSLSQIGFIQIDKGDYDKAFRTFTDSMEIEKDLGDKLGIALCLHQISMIHYHKGEYDEALSKNIESLEIKKELGNKGGIAKSLHQIGMIHERKGDYNKAISEYSKSLSIKKELGDKLGISRSLRQLGIVHFYKKEYDKALAMYTESLNINKELGSISEISESLHQIGMIHYIRRNFNAALKAYSEALDIFRRHGRKSGISSTLHQIGMILTDSGYDEKALEAYSDSIAIAKEIGDKSGIASTLHEIGIIHQRRSDYDTAIAMYTKSIKIKRKIGDIYGLGTSCSQLGKLYLLLFNFKKACEFLSQAVIFLEYLKSEDLRGISFILNRFKRLVGEDLIEEYMEQARKELRKYVGQQKK